MQTIVQVICSKGPSLREKIANDAKLEQYGLIVTREKQALRSPGWMKLLGIEGQSGAINVEWDADTQILTCRVVTRGRTGPGLVVSHLVWYLLERYKARVRTIQILTPGRRKGDR